MEENFYTILGVNRNADDATIKKAYRELARTYHPDKNPNNQEAAQKMKDINTAYATLSDATLRTQYNRLLDQKEQEGRVRSREYPPQDFSDTPHEPFIWVPGMPQRQSRGNGFYPGRIYGDLGDFFEDLHIYRQKQRQKLHIPLYDLRLVSALYLVFSEKVQKSAQLDVVKDMQDTRSWMPSPIYRITAENAHDPKILRTLADWALPDTDEIIHFTTKNNEPKSAHVINAYFPESLLRRPDAFIPDEIAFPNGYGEYLSSLRSLAFKYFQSETAQESVPIQNEVDGIHRYLSLNENRYNGIHSPELLVEVSFQSIGPAIRESIRGIAISYPNNKEGGKPSNTERW